MTMKNNIGPIKTAWTLSVLCALTGLVCFKSICKYFFSTPTREWVDKTIHQWVDKLLDQVEVSYQVINPLNIKPQPGCPTILMCNHSSLYDIPLSFKAFPQHSIRMLAKKELSKIPIMGKGMAAAEFPFIDRKNRYQAIKDLKYVEQLMKSGILMWIAPEGTRSKNGKLAPLKKGAFITAIQAQATIIPIGIRGAFDIIPAKTFCINIKQKAEIHIGEPIDASTFSLENKDQLIEKTHQSLKKLTGEDN